MITRLTLSLSVRPWHPLACINCIANLNLDLPFKDQNNTKEVTHTHTHSHTHTHTRFSHTHKHPILSRLKWKHLFIRSAARSETQGFMNYKQKHTIQQFINHKLSTTDHITAFETVLTSVLQFTGKRIMTFSPISLQRLLDLKLNNRWESLRHDLAFHSAQAPSVVGFFYNPWFMKFYDFAKSYPGQESIIPWPSFLLCQTNCAKCEVMHHFHTFCEEHWKACFPFHMSRPVKLYFIV